MGRSRRRAATRIAARAGPDPGGPGRPGPGQPGNGRAAGTPAAAPVPGPHTQPARDRPWPGTGSLGPAAHQHGGHAQPAWRRRADSALPTGMPAACPIGRHLQTRSYPACPRRPGRPPPQATSCTRTGYVTSESSRTWARDEPARSAAPSHTPACPPSPTARTAPPRAHEPQPARTERPAAPAAAGCEHGPAACLAARPGPARHGQRPGHPAGLATAARVRPRAMRSLPLAAPYRNDRSGSLTES